MSRNRENYEEDPVEQALEDGIRLGIIEVVGINSKGDWIYAATPKGRAMFAEGNSMREALIQIETELKNLDKFS